MFINKYKSKCKSCNKQLNPGEGFAYKKNNIWGAVCNSTACHTKLGITEEKQEAKITEDGFLFMPYNPDAIILLRSLPGGKWIKENKSWQFSLAPGDLPRVVEIADQLKLDIPESFRIKIAEGTQDSREALQRAERKRSDGKGLYNFQKEGVKFLSLHNKCLLADDQGIGKTVQVLVAIPENEQIIIVCPASLKYNWQDEAVMWRPDYKTIICDGRDSFVFPNPGEVVIINYDILPKELQLPKQDKNAGYIPFSKLISQYVSQEYIDKLSKCSVIYDEIQAGKNYKSIRSQKIKVLSYLCKRVWSLTGTPLMNRPTDLYGILEASNLNPLGGWSTFVGLFNGHTNAHGGYEFGMPSPEVHERLKKVMLRRLKVDVLPDLPKKTYKEIKFDIDHKTAKYLNGFTIKAAIEQGLIDEKDANKVDINYLLDIMDTADLPDFKEFAKVRAMLAESRIPAMLEIVESYEESETPLVVFSAHRKPIDTLENRDGWAVITGDTKPEERRNIVRRFQTGELKGVGLTIQAGGVGLTLTLASHVLFVDLDWTPAMNVQAADRVCRIGATAVKILILRMVSDHPLDKHIQALLEFKIELAYQALDAKYEVVINERSNVELWEESEEELETRIKEANEKVDRECALKKLSEIVDRESAKVNHVPEPKIDSERKELLRKALGYMCGMCDGANKKDGVGFNKPDASIAHRIYQTGLREEDELPFRVLERILVRYRATQLSGMFDEVWN